MKTLGVWSSVKIWQVINEPALAHLGQNGLMVNDLGAKAQPPSLIWINDEPLHNHSWS